MDESVTELLMRMLAELDKAEGLQAEKLAVIKLEKERVKRALLAAKTEVLSPQVEMRPRQVRAPRRLASMTLKQAVLDILADSENGLQASEILKELNIKHNASFMRGSLSPQISRLRKDGAILHSDGIWHLPTQVPRHPTPKVSHVTSQNDIFNLEELPKTI
jgi:hypothetical protein